MKKRRSIIALCAVLFATTLLALPGGAWATGGEKTEASHAKIEGRAESVAYFDSLREAVNDAKDGETVTLIADDTNSYSNSVDIKKSIVINLNGKTLTGSTGATVLQVGANNISATVKNGTIATDKQRGVYVSGYNSIVKLENVFVSATSVDYEAVCVQKGSLELDDTTLSSGSTYSLKIESDGSVTVNSGTVKGDVENDGSLSITGGDFLGTVPTTGTLNITGGSFKDCSLRGSISADYLMQYMLPNAETEEPARYVVISGEDEDSVRDSSGLYLQWDSQRAIYYEYGTEYDVAWNDYGTYTVPPKYVYRVTFKDGDDVTYCGRLQNTTIGTLPKKEDTDEKFFLGWYNGDDKAETWITVTKDITYEAKWADAIAEYNGTKYTSLQAAITAATESGSEATVKLLNDTTESVEVPAGAKLTIDLNGKTLAALSAGTNLNAISLKGARELTIDNGIVSSGGRCVYADYDISTGSTVTLGDQLTCTSSGTQATVDVESKDKAETPTKFIIQGGSYINTGSGAALRIDGPELSIVDGGFTSTSDDTIIIRDTVETNLSCDISGHIDIASYVSKDKVTIQPGTTFGDDKNKGYINTNEYHLLPNNDSRYEVSAHEKSLVVDVKPTATTDGSGHYECDVDGCGWKSDSVVIPAGGDVDAPVIAGLAAGAAYDVSKTFNVTDASDFTVTVDGKEIDKNLDGSFTLPFGENMTVVAKDKWGNASSVANVSNYKDHEWGNAVDDADGEHHTYTCAHSACEVKTRQESHSGGEATCKTKAVCDVCHASYGEPDPNNHEGAVSSGYSHDDDNHWKTYSCCGAVVSGTVHAHELETVVVEQPTETEDGLQYDKCKDCTYRGENQVIPATGGAPVINGLVNGGSYDLEDDKPTFTVTAPSLKEVTVNGEVVTPSEEGVYTLKDTGESVEVVATDNNGKSTTVTVSCYENHDWGDWQGNGNGTHYRNCKHTGCKAHQDRDCNGGAATCVSRAVCADCGLEYGDINPDNHTGSSTWHYDGDEHWKTCDSCDAEIADSRAEHSIEQCYDENEHWDSCECGYESERVKHALVQKSDESGHWQECSDCGYATAKEDHTYEWVVDKEATATEDGHKHQECKTCGYKNGEEETIPKTGDDSSDDDDKGDDSGKKDDKKDGKKDDAKKLPATGDPELIVSGLAAAGATLAALGFKRRK